MKKCNTFGTEVTFDIKNNYKSKVDIMQNSIRLSVIIPMYQSEKYISECIRSVSSQAIEEIEIICVDDGCTDNTCNIVQ